jgi:dimethylargininase
VTHNTVIVRAPGPRVVDGIVAYRERVRVDAARARDQWDRYVAGFVRNGWTVVHAPDLPGAPDGVFVEDTAVVYGEVGIITRPGVQPRRDETTGMREVMSGLGLAVHELQPPATLDGGDVLKVGDVVYVGLSTRTDSAGAGQLAEILEPLGAQVVAVPVTGALHLKSCVTALPDGTVLGHGAVGVDAAVFASFLSVPEESGAHVVVLDESTVLLAADCPRTQRMLAERGYRTEVVDVSEFQKLDGCVTCLSVRVRRR